MRRFRFQLASQLGCTVAELATRLSSRELSEWYAFIKHEPFGITRLENQIAILTAITYNVNRGKDAPLREANEFMVTQWPTAQFEPELDDEFDDRDPMIAQAIMITLSNGGTVAPELLARYLVE